MPTKKTYRYALPRKSIKGQCPSCGERHRKTLSRYVDTHTGEPIPEQYGICDRADNCAYSLSPYAIDPATGTSYARQQGKQGDGMLVEVDKAWFASADAWLRTSPDLTKADLETRLMAPPVLADQAQAHRVATWVLEKAAARQRLAAPAEEPVCLPDELMRSSLGRYDKNPFARLLTTQFGPALAADLLARFRVGTSSAYGGSTVFWYIDERGRVRGGQIKRFGHDWHTERHESGPQKGKQKVTFVHAALAYKCRQENRPTPPWLADYVARGTPSPCLFGLPQLFDAHPLLPVAIVESPKTAIICAAHLPGQLWMAVGAESYLTTARLAPLLARQIMLYPDLGAYQKWSVRAVELRAQGFSVRVSDQIETLATPAQREKGWDLADFLLAQGNTTTPATVALTQADNEVEREALKARLLSLIAASDLEQSFLAQIGADWPDLSVPGLTSLLSALETGSHRRLAEVRSPPPVAALRVDPGSDGWQGRLDKAQAWLDDNPPPQEPVELPGGTIHDPARFVAHNLAVLRANPGRAVFLPYLEQLEAFVRAVRPVRVLSAPPLHRFTASPDEPKSAGERLSPNQTS